jgi:glucose-1-phosphate adenylyltransferase
MLLAGGIGERLYPLTSNRAKPAVPFGGNFRVIDFTLMNCVLSGLRNTHLLTQYHAQSLNSHLLERWNFLSSELGEYIELVPPKLRAAHGVYRGTADAIYRNLDLLDRSRPDLVLVLSGDHVYRADYAKFIESHVEREADVSVLTGSVEPGEASSFGVINVEQDGASGSRASGTEGRITSFVEKPADPSPYAIDGRCLINLGVYCFETTFLVEQLVADAKKKSAHDFGKNILPASLDQGTVLSCPLDVISPDAAPYWRDVGSIDSYFKASMDLLASPAAFDLRDPRWMDNSRFREWLPAMYTTSAQCDGKTVHGKNLVSSGVRIEDSQVVNCIISPRVVIKRGCELEGCIIFPDAEVGEGTKLRNVIVEEGVRVPAGTRIGLGEGARQFTMSPDGVVAIPGNRHFACTGAPAPEETPVAVAVEREEQRLGVRGRLDTEPVFQGAPEGAAG